MPFTMLFCFSVVIFLTISVIIVITPSVSDLATWALANKDVTASDGENLQYVIYENTHLEFELNFLDSGNLKLQKTYLKTL